MKELGATIERLCTREWAGVEDQVTVELVAGEKRQQVFPCVPLSSISGTEAVDPVLLEALRVLNCRRVVSLCGHLVLLSFSSDGQ